MREMTVQELEGGDPGAGEIVEVEVGKAEMIDGMTGRMIVTGVVIGVVTQGVKQVVTGMGSVQMIVTEAANHEVIVGMVGMTAAMIDAMTGRMIVTGVETLEVIVGMVGMTAAMMTDGMTEMMIETGVEKQEVIVAVVGMIVAMMSESHLLAVIETAAKVGVPVAKVGVRPAMTARHSRLCQSSSLVETWSKLVSSPGQMQKHRSFLMLLTNESTQMRLRRYWFDFHALNKKSMVSCIV